MDFEIIINTQRVTAGFRRWMEALEEQSADCAGYWELQGQGVRFRPLPGVARTEFWVGKNAHTAVQINLPSDPATENGASALATDSDGHEYIVRQGVLHKNQASDRIEPDVFVARTRLEPISTTLGGAAASRDWFVVTQLSGIDAPTIAQNTAEFVRHCWVARGQSLDDRTGATSDFPDATVATTNHPYANSLPSGRVWVTSFWGFNPEGDGYFGFTREGDRTAFLRQWRPGDLVMIYATMGENTEEAHKGRVMGFLEVEPRTIRDVDRMSPEGLQWKLENKVADRWTYALPVVRAWRAVDLPEVRALAQTTLGQGANWQLIASGGCLCYPKKRRRLSPSGFVPWTSTAKQPYRLRKRRRCMSLLVAFR
jgi:hypothetical protein